MSESSKPQALELGLQALQRGDLDAARAHLQAAALAAPTDPVPLGYLGTVYGRREEWDAAIHTFQRAVELSPDSAPLRYNLGLALERGGQTQAALAAFQAALSLDPTHAASQEAIHRLQPVVTAAPAPAAPASSPGAVPMARAIPLSAGTEAGLRPAGGTIPRLVWMALVGVFAAIVVCGGIYAFLFFREYHPVDALVRTPRRPKPPVVVPKTDPAALTALPSGPGLVVCDPVSFGVSGADLDFATGCGHWLHFAAAAQPEFGRTPMWSSLEGPCIVLNRPWLRIAAAEVERVASLTGVSHVAVGEVRRENGALRLTYRIIDVEAGKPVGAAVELQGSEAAIRAALPGAARKLCAVLGVAQPKLPPLEDGVMALRAAGAMPIPSDHSRTEARRKALISAKEGPLAAFLLFTHPPNEGGFYRTHAEAEAATGRSLLSPKALREVKEHPLVLAAIAVASWQGSTAGTARNLQPTIDRLLQRYPNNYALHAARVYSLRAAGKFADAIAEGQQAVRCSPTNPDAWRSLCGTYHQWSDSVRGGRVFAKMTERETRLCQDAYQEWMEVSSHNVSLQPGSFFSQIDFATACLYSGEEEQGMDAARKAIEMAPAHPEGYRSVLAMCLPHWYDRPEDAAATLRLAAKVANSSEWWTPGDRVGIATHGAACGQIPLARALLRTRSEQAALNDWIRDEEQMRQR